MKNTIKITLLLTALAVSFVACEKDNTAAVDANNDTNVNMVKKDRVIIYTVGNDENRQTLRTEAEWDSMLEQLCDQAYNGSEVTFYNISAKARLSADKKNGTKDNRTITTDSREEMKQWMKAMEKQGLTVHVTYNENSGTWHGEAYETTPSNSTSCTIVGTWHLSRIVVSQLDSAGQSISSDLYEPDTNGGSMYYTFLADGTMSLTINGMGGIPASDSSTWSLSDDGILSCELLPNGVAWNVNWITHTTMIFSRTALGTEDGNQYYQLQFEGVDNNK